MARTRSLVDLRLDARKLADLENAIARFGDPEVNEYVNKGLAYVYRQIINVQDRPFYQKDASFRTFGANSSSTPIPTSYPMADDFLQIMSVMWCSTGLGAGPWIPLQPYEECERTQLINAGYYGAMWPRYYGIVGGSGAYTQGTIPTAYAMEILPAPPNGSMISYRYIPTCPRLTLDTDTFDGILGFEDAVSTWAAVLMRRKDDLDTADLERDMARHVGEIRTLAKRRDRSGPPKVQLTRNRLRGRGGGFGGYGGRGTY